MFFAGLGRIVWNQEQDLDEVGRVAQGMNHSHAREPP
jgi:hypothetical protein